MQKIHILDENRLDVQRLDPVPTQDIRGTTYNNLVLVRGLTPDISHDQLMLHLEQLTGSDVVDICYSVDPSIVLVYFEREIDFYLLWEHCCRYPLNRTMLGVQKSPIMLELQVLNIANIGDDSLSLYFQNTGRSGGCEDVDVDINRDDGYAIITCPNTDVHSAILDKKHRIDGTELSVNMYCKAIGILPRGFDCKNPVRIPESVNIEVRDTHLVSFICSSSTAKKQMDEILQPLHGCVDWSGIGASPNITIRCMLSRSDKGAAILGVHWEDNIKNEMEHFLSSFETKEVKTLNAVWTKVKQAISNLNYPSEKMSLDVDDNACQVLMSGYAKQVDKVHKDIDQMVRKKEEMVERAKQTLKEKVKLHSVQSQALVALQFRKKALEKWPKLKVSIQCKTNEGVLLNGLAKEIKHAKIMMYELLQQLVNQRRPTTDLKLQLLASKETRAELVKILKTEKILAVWEVDGQDLVVYAQTTETIDLVFQILDEEVDHMPIEIPDASRQALSAKSWNNLLSKMLRQNEGKLLVEPAANHSSIDIACLHKSSTKVMEQINSFLSENTILERMVSLPMGPAKVIALYMEKDLKSIEAKHKASLVEIQTVEQLEGFEFQIKGNQNGLENADADLRSLLKKIESMNHSINKPGIPKYFNSEQGRYCLEGFQTKYKVIVQVDEKICKLSTSEKFSGQEEKCRVKDHYGPQLIVLKADLTTHNVDIIVNAANEDLAHIGGLAKALADKGGPAIQKESTQFITTHGQLQEGQIAVTTSGNLPCHKLIHAVGPRYKEGSGNEENLLYEVVYLCLEKASKLKASTIALPAISTGVFSFPLHPATKIIVEAVSDYCRQEQKENTLQEIHLVDNKTPTVDAFQGAIESLYGKPNGNYRERPGHGEPHENFQTGHGSTKSTPQSLYCPTSDPMALITADGVTVSLVKGTIATQKVDAIVNTTTTSLDLNTDAVSSSILKAAGDGLQVECQQNYPNGVQFGEVIATNGHDLPCKFVFHGSCPKFDGDGTEAEKALRRLVANSLMQANGKELSSIAIPAIATGNLGVPAGMVAQAMYDEVGLYSQRNAGKQTVNDVRFIIFDQDTAILDVFTKELQSLISGKPQVNASASPTQSPPTGTANTRKGLEGKVGKLARTYSFEGDRNCPSYTVSGDGSNKSTPQALYSPTTDTMALITADGVTVTLVKGSIAMQKVDAILNTTTTSLELNTGAVSSSILKAAGDDLQVECQQNFPNGVQFGEVVATSGHELPCTFIFHGSCPKFDGGGTKAEKYLRAMVANSLKLANEMGLSYISMPAIGTGNLGAPSELVARAMYDEVCLYSHRNAGKQTVKDVRFIIFDQDTAILDAFSRELQFLLSGKPQVNTFASSTQTSPTGTAKTRRRQQGKVVKSTSTNSCDKKENLLNDRESEDEMFGEVHMTDGGEQQMYFGPIQLQVKQGDITMETTDAIVNSSNKNLDLTKGAVAKAIATAGGCDILEDCKKLGGINDLVAVTCAGNLPSKKIIHVDAPHSKEEWRVVIRRCLEEADNLQFSSIAFPALGTGEISGSPVMMASLMLDTIAEFSHKNPKYLNLIRVTIFQPDMLNVFHNQMQGVGARKKLLKNNNGHLTGISNGNEQYRTAGLDTKPKITASTPDPCKISFTIYGQSNKNITAVAKELDKMAISQCQEKVIGRASDHYSDCIKNLSEEQVNMIKSLEQRYDVKIKVIKGKHVNQIKMQGSPADLITIRDHIQHVFHEVDTDNWRKQEAELLKDQVQWEFLQEETRKWEGYSININALLEKSYREQKAGVTWKEEIPQGKITEYKVNFAEKRECIIGETAPGREVRRRDLTDGSVPLPDSWEDMKPEELFHKSTIKTDVPEYKYIEKEWRSTLESKAVTLTKIERIQNPSLYRRYLLHKKHLDEFNPTGTNNELKLWHGTAAPPIESINSQGFNRSYCGVNGVVYGNGVYFATNSSYSLNYAIPDNNGNCHMFLARVLVGQYTEGKGGMKAPPPKDSRKPSILYDSVVDKTDNPSMYIVFSDTQAYPEYLLTFRHIE